MLDRRWPTYEEEICAKPHTSFDRIASFFFFPGTAGVQEHKKEWLLTNAVTFISPGLNVRGSGSVLHWVPNGGGAEEFCSFRL
ncbi:hypothetical protein CEXT_400501, partial [Caerostris extrusa]